MSANFYELGGNSLNSIFTVTKLRDAGYLISITDFITASTLGEIIDKMRLKGENHSQNTDNNDDDDLNITCDLGFECIPLELEHKDDTIDIITESFFEKADLEQYIKDEVLRTDYADILNMIWDVLVEKGLSFIVKDSNGRSVGVALNFDARDEPAVEVNSKLVVVFEFLEYLEGPIR